MTTVAAPDTITRREVNSRRNVMTDNSFMLSSLLNNNKNHKHTKTTCDLNAADVAAFRKLCSALQYMVTKFPATTIKSFCSNDLVDIDYDDNTPEVEPLVIAREANSRSHTEYQSSKGDNDNTRRHASWATTTEVNGRAFTGYLFSNKDSGSDDFEKTEKYYENGEGPIVKSKASMDVSLSSGQINSADDDEEEDDEH